MMKKLLSLLFLLVLAIVGSWSLLEHRVYSQTSAEIEQTVNFKQHFDNLGVNGSMFISLPQIWSSTQKMLPQHG